MSDLPSGWALAKMGDLAHWGSGGTPKSDVAEYYGGNIPWVVTGDLTDGPVLTSTRTLTEMGLAKSSAKLVPSGTLLVAMYGASIGRVGIASMPLATNQAIANAQVHPQVVEPTYLLYYLLSQRSALVAAGKGAAQPNIGQGILKEWPIPIAPLAEQARIVNAIDEQFSRLDAGVVAIQQTQARLEAFTRSVETNALGGAYSENVPFAVGAVEIIETKRAARRTGRRKKPVVLPAGKLLPRGWAWTTLDEIAADRPNALKAGPFGSALKKEFYVERGYKVYGQEQVIRGDASYGNYYISDEKYRSLASCAVLPRDLLISLVGTIGKTLILDKNFEQGIINPRLIKVSLDEDVISPEYLAIVLQSSAIRARLKLESHGGTMDVINLGMLRRLPIPCPPPEHQAVIVERLTVHSDLTEHFKTALESARRHATALRYSILAAAFSGRLVPQEPSDEPASLLLERLAAQ